MQSILASIKRSLVGTQTNQHDAAAHMTLSEGYLPVPYNLKKFNFINRIAKHKKKISTRRAPTMFNLVRNGKDPLKNAQRSGVYKILVENARTKQKSAYIGIMKRMLAQRIEEHRRDISKGKLITALSVKAYSDDLLISWDQVKIIRRLNALS